MNRARDEASIHRLASTFGREFERALYRALSRHSGLSFWTDEQLAEIRTHMVADAWFRHRLNRENRRRRAA